MYKEAKVKILLEELPHQERALESIDKAFLGLDEQSKFADSVDANYVFANPLLKGRYTDFANIDVKMETGTGKTYVGTRMMYELHKKYGLFKFVIVVPTPAIKEGWKSFITSDYAQQHFTQFYENTNINLSVINAGDFGTKKGRKNIPAKLFNFIEGSRQVKNTIEVLLVNAAMLTSKSMTNEYDQTLLSGWNRPVDGIKATRPVVLIDEPHRFPFGKANYNSILEIKPQMIVRFGATYPEIKEGTGRNAVVKKWYYRGKPQFNLNAVDSFNQGLVKGIDVYYPLISQSEAQDVWKVSKVTARELILKQNDTTRQIGVGEDIGFDGDITYAGGKELSNGLEISEGMQFLPSTMTSSYQELIIKDAIDKHFATEQQNFMRENLYENNLPRVKTLSLFFIDSIKSYRDETGWLKETFERLLAQKVSKLISEYQEKSLPREREYLEFLKATQRDISAAHAGYFGEDRGSGDAAIQAEIDDILSNKEKMLTFKDDAGRWNTRRFLFSKWTLREGWDNPNVFVIAKLRTSGSENSKIQEVGRGLRLPVDETGHRLQQVNFSSRLSFLIGYDEKEFAKKLIGEINDDVELVLSETELDQSTINIIIKNHPEMTEDVLRNELGNSQIIDFSGKYKTGGFTKLLELYPEVGATQLQEGKVTEPGAIKPKTRIKLNKDNWQELKELWQQFSKRYMIRFDKLDLSFLIDEVFGNPDNYERVRPEQVHQELAVESQAVLKEQVATYDTRQYLDGMPYGQFLQKLTLETDIPVKELHRVILPVIKNKSAKYLSERTLSNLTREWQKRFAEKYAANYHYDALNFMASSSVYDASANVFKDDVLAEALGINSTSDGIREEEHFLYENPPLRYDSTHPERDMLTHGYGAKVTAFGKLPKRAIQVPKYTGGTTTPDFVYVIERDENKDMYLLVETKAENMRDGDHRIQEIQSKFFAMLKDHGVEYQLATDAQQVYRKIEELGGDE